MEIENVIKTIFPEGVPGMSVPRAYYSFKKKAVLSILIYNDDNVQLLAVSDAPMRSYMYPFLNM